MIIKLFNPETGDNAFIDIFNGGTSLELSTEIAEELCLRYEEECDHGCTVGGLIRFIKDIGYKVREVQIHEIEFNH